jgi:chromatin remodeling complex protein RSC6
MSEDLSLIRNFIQEEIDKLTRLKHDIESQINESIKSVQTVQSENKYSRVPSKFIKPANISDELALFIGIKKGTLISRIEVTRSINKYIRTNNLVNSVNKHKINPDNKLSTLFKLNDGDELTYYKIQKYIGLHFI